MAATALEASLQVSGRVGNARRARPAAGFHRVQEVGEMLIECGWLLQIHRVAAVRHDDEASGWDRAFHQDAGLEARPILVAGHHQGRRGDSFHLLD